MQMASGGLGACFQMNNEEIGSRLNSCRQQHDRLRTIFSGPPTPELRPTDALATCCSPRERESR